MEKDESQIDENKEPEKVQKEEVFKGKRSLMRTPPQHGRNSSWGGENEDGKANEEGTGEGVRKRPRKISPDKPEEQTREEKVQGQTQSQQQKPAKKTTGNASLDQIIQLKDQIKTATQRELNHKISFNKQDQLSVCNSLDKIIEVATRLTTMKENEATKRKTLEEKVRGLENIVDIQKWRMIEQKKEYEELKTQLREQNEMLQRMMEEIISIKTNQKGMKEETRKLRKTFIEEIERAEQMREEEEREEEEEQMEGEDEERQEIQTTKTQNRTYAQITQKPKKIKTQERDNNTWKSPEQKDRWETVIRKKKNRNEEENMETEQDRADIKEIKKHLLEAKLEGPIRGIWETKGGGIVVQCTSEQQRETVKKTIQQKGEYTIKETNLQKPIIKLTGIEVGWEDDELIEEIVRQNREKLPMMQDRIPQEELKILNRRPCRNPQRENILIELRPEIFRNFIGRDDLTFDLMKLYIEEHVAVPLCYKCYTYGHVQKHCREQEQKCHKCGGNHVAKDCIAEDWDCINCKKVGLEQRRHSARDKRCPVFQRRKEQVRASITYN